MILRQFLNFSMYQLVLGIESNTISYILTEDDAAASITRINVNMEDVSSGKYKFMKNCHKLGRDVGGRNPP